MTLFVPYFSMQVYSADHPDGVFDRLHDLIEILPNRSDASRKRVELGGVTDASDGSTQQCLRDLRGMFEFDVVHE